MKSLDRKILSEATYLGNGIIKVDRFLNHRVDTALMTEIGNEFSRQLTAQGITGINKIVTAETSGIAPALTTAQALGVPMVFARKKPPVTMKGNGYTSSVHSHTKEDRIILHISKEFLSAEDRIVLIDDFLGVGETTTGLVALIKQSGAQLCAIGFVLEKTYEQGRKALNHLGVPIISLARLNLQGEKIILVP